MLTKKSFPGIKHDLIKTLVMKELQERYLALKSSDKRENEHE
jgi:hypothetical protein